MSASMGGEKSRIVSEIFRFGKPGDDMGMNHGRS